ncbi:TauD/TfdA family dioxygenase [Amycolatopsis japonica]|uniref:TauD/TfdA family dioxygenase n=1 Tax=Amycolatopsis japonica TaxID=208439 RepID=UPI0036735ACC
MKSLDVTTQVDEEHRLGAQAPVVRIDLDSDEAAAITECAEAMGPSGARIDEIVGDARVIAAELPRRIRSFIERFRLAESAGAALIRGVPIDPDNLGPTPTSLEDLGHHRTAIADRSLTVLATLAGDIFGWAAERDGALIHDLVPLRGHEKEQSGVSSDTVLGWHTDEAYHPLRCDYLGLLCLRNPDGVPTKVSVLDVTSLSGKHRDLLFRSEFVIRPESAHGEDNPVADSTVPILFGPRDDPYLRFDEGYTDLSAASDDCQAAFAELSKMFASEHSLSIVLEPGDLLLVDNYRSVHARGAFTARFDGTDRWLKRTYITRDLRKSRLYRSTPSSRVVF